MEVTMEDMHKSRKAVINRLSRAIGHLEAVKRMVEEGKDCSEILIQLAAVKSAVNNIGKMILKDHLSHCITDAAKNNNQQALEDFSEAIDRFMK
ncbi:MAG: metal-sensing transcriptional repressor [Candidatus Fimenecus sp.]